uniref:Uncharacterized protein n=1 Tax=Panagrolaimus davidi TaxID=227884 RepID=A0A914P5Q5_9BILA
MTSKIALLSSAVVAFIVGTVSASGDFPWGGGGHHGDSHHGWGAAPYYGHSNSHGNEGARAEGDQFAKGYGNAFGDGHDVGHAGGKHFNHENSNGHGYGHSNGWGHSPHHYADVHHAVEAPHYAAVDVHAVPHHPY